MSPDAPPAIGDFPVGALISGYRIDQIIGRGGMAVVYRATDSRLDRTVALKVLAPELARDDSFRQRFLRESRSGAAVDHPNVIPVYEAGEDNGVLYIAMRYVTGSDVRELIERHGPLPATRAVSIVTQVASALDAAHGHGLIHRDVKPANILLAEQSDGTARRDHVYLSDFGLSKASISTSHLTGTGQFLGTIDYMSPEQIEGRPVDGRTDLYALACAAFEMLTGDPPFRRDANLAVMWAQVAASPPSVRDRRPELSPEVDRVLAKALAKSPNDRQSTCMEFATALRAACAIRPAAAAHPSTQVVPEARQAGVVPEARQAGVVPEARQAGIVPEARKAGVVPEARKAGALPEARQVGALPETRKARTPPVPTALGPENTVTDAPIIARRVTGGGGAPAGPPAATGRGQYGDWSGQPADTARLLPGGSGYPPGWTTAPTGPPRRRRRALSFLVGLFVVLLLAAAAVYVLHLRGHGQPVPRRTITITPTPRSASGSPTSPASSPAGVVQAYFAAINRQDYQTAWNIDAFAHNGQTYDEFKNGFAGTSSDQVTSISTSGNTVSVRFTANQTDGTVKYYAGTYTVQNGQITGANISPASGP